MMTLSWLMLIVVTTSDKKIDNGQSTQRNTAIFPQRVCIVEAAFDYIVPLLMLRPIPKNRNPINNDK